MDLPAVDTAIRAHQSQPTIGRWLCVVMLSLALLGTGARAQSQVPTVAAGDIVDIAEIEAAIESVSAQTGLDEAVRSQVISVLRGAQSSVKEHLAADESAAAFASSLETAPAETEKLLTALDRVPRPVPTIQSIGIRDGMTLPDLEQMLVSESSEFTRAQSEVASLEQQIETQHTRPARIRARITELRNRLSAPPPAGTAAQGAGQPTILLDARRLSQELARQAMNAEINALNQELLSNGVRLELLTAKLRSARADMAERRTRVEILQSVVNERRNLTVAEARESAIRAELAAADKHPVVRSLAEGNAALSDELRGVATGIERATGTLARTDGQASQLEQNFSRSQQRLEIGGINQTIGRLFVEERRNLPKVSQYRAQVKERRKTLANIGLAQVRIEEQLHELDPLQNRIDQLVADVAGEPTFDGDLESIRGEIDLLLQDRRGLLNQAAGMYTTYLRALSDLDIALRRLLDTTVEYTEFLDQNLLWIPSSPVVGKSAITNLVAAGSWALSPKSWSDVAIATLESLRDDPVAALLAALLLGLTLASRRPLNRRYVAMNQRVGRLTTDHIGLTLASLGIAAARALPLPLTLAILGYLLVNSPLNTDFTAAVSRSALVLAPFLYNTLLFRVLCASEGVALIHFGWSEKNLAIIRRQVDRFTAIGVPIVFVAVLLYSSPVAAHRDSLGRLAYVALMLVFSAVARPLAHPVTGVPSAHYRANPTGWLSRFRWLWYALAAGVPLLLAALAIIGYMYTAAILTGRLIDTFWLVLAISIVNMIVLRWLTLARRKIALQLALEKREERKAEASETSQPEPEPAGDIPAPAPTPIDLDAIDMQTRRLLHAGLFFVGILAAWGIWSDVLPALNILEKVSLWTQTGTVDGVETILPVTLADLMLAIVIIGVTLITSRNLPGLMEIALLQRMTLLPGSRYAINTLVRYVVITIGVVSVLNIIGWKWSQIQWLVAALSVGLGFGLQEIVANFVSGLVILFERPVRVGDTVTVGQLTGTVARIRIRATTITDWDRKEILVPNKAFITEQVINWTLTDPITRLVIPVGISYGSDVQLAHRVMADTLAALPLVLDDPAPRVYFTGFGESSLDFKLYVYSRQLEDRLPLTHAVHEEILGALRKHNIEIPFPQRDLHVRSVADGVRGAAAGSGNTPGNGD